MKKILIILKFSALMIVMCVQSLNAQQLEQWTQFALNEYTINPAVSGADEYYHASVMFRNQWAGITDAPRTYYLSVQGPMWGDRMGMGGSVFNDVVGPISKAGLQLSYAYHAKLSNTHKLSFSLSGSIFQWAANGAEMNLENVNDIAVSSGNMSRWVPDFGFGTRFSGEKLHVGFYVPQIANMQVDFFDDYNAEENRLSRHYYFNAGYKQPFGDFTLDANFFSRYVSGIFMQEFNVRGIYKESVWLGASARLPIVEEVITAVGMMVGYQFQNNMQIGYSYDLDLGKIGNASNGSHELFLGIRFSKKNNKPLIPATDL